MEYDTLHDYCLAKPNAQLTFPFGDMVCVFKVNGKIFALLPIEKGTPHISLKCEPTWAQVFRQTYPTVKPGYHLNKEHWNTITCDGTIAEGEILGMVDHSYDLITKGSKRSKSKAPKKTSPQ